ncbi:MAG: L-threonylcarbamoyladenylate synthase [Akkermansiaceae bacterium]
MFDTKTIEATDDGMMEAQEAAVALLHEGEVVALPTETVYGLAADAFNPEAVAKIFEAKERPHFDPLIVHIATLADLERVADVPEDIQKTVAKLAEEFWPGPLTIILPKTAEVPDLVTSGLPTVGVRQSGHPIFRSINKALGNPLAAPSANRFGRISPTSAQAVMKELGGRIPLIIDAGACNEGIESTIIRIEPREGKKPIFHLHRAGPITKEKLQPFGKIQKVKPSSKLEAPGQLESHYAPTTPFRLISKPEDFTPEPGKTYGLLSYKGEESGEFVRAHRWDSVVALSPGNGKQAEAAVRLFYLMREMDEMGLDEIIAEPLSEVGLGVAIMDRLRRASTV